MELLTCYWMWDMSSVFELLSLTFGKKQYTHLYNTPKGVEILLWCSQICLCCIWLSFSCNGLVELHIFTLIVDKAFFLLLYLTRITCDSFRFNMS